MTEDPGFGAFVTPMQVWGGRAVTERPWFWSFDRPKTSIPRSFCHSHAGLAGRRAVTTLVVELWEAQNLNSQVFLSLLCGPGGGGAGSDRKTWFFKSQVFLSLPCGSGRGGGSDRKTLVLELWEAQNLNSQAFLSLPCSPGRGGGSDRKTLVLELWEAQNLNSQVFLLFPCGPGGGGRAVTERPWFWSFGRPKTSILRSFCHSHAGLGEGRAVTERSFGRPKTSIFRSLCHSHAGLGGGERAVTERPWFWSFERPKTSILRSFCHSHAGLGGGRAVTERRWFWSLGGPKPQFSGLFVTSMRAREGGGQ